jgi:DNA-directed RNA polymerase subunit M/transcription elongation factor TFIIS
MKCPNCQARIMAKNYDPDYEMYECPKCGGSFTPDEIVKQEVESLKPVAKAKKRMTEIQEDEEAFAKFEAEELKPRKSADAATVHHRDEVPTGQVLNIFADEIELIGQEIGVQIDRLNAREFFAMNLWRTLALKHGVHARDKSIPHVLCEDHE